MFAVCVFLECVLKINNTLRQRKAYYVENVFKEFMAIGLPLLVYR